MLTASKQSKNGYYVSALGVNVYSVEELNYVIYNHIDLIYRDFFSEELFSYIEKELRQPLMADELREISYKRGTLGDFVKYILNGSGYYNDRELAEISHLVSGIDTMGKSERMKIQGDAAYKAGKYNTALRCFMEILKNMGSEDVNDTFYARVAYSAGSIYARLFMARSANSLFAQAYELYPDPMYARAAVYMSILAGDDEELLSSIVRYRITDESLESIKNRVESLKKEIASGEGLKILEESLNDRDMAEAVSSEWKKEYYSMLK